MSNERTIETPKTSDLVTQTIKINGEEVSRKLNIAAITVNKEINRLPSARISIYDGNAASGDFPVSNTDLFTPGNNVEILAGYHSEEDTIFKGVIVKNNIRMRREGLPLFTVDCRDASYKTSLIQKSRYFYEKNDSEIIEEILGDYELETDIESTEVTHPEVIQFDVTDWDFIMTRIDLNGKVGLVDDGEFSVKSPEIADEEVVKVTYGATMLEFDGEIDGRLQYSGVKAFSWNYSSQEISGAEASEPGTSEPGNISAKDIASSLEMEVFQMQHGGSLSDEVMQLWADARLLKNRLAKVRGRVKFKGKADVKPGKTIAIEGVGDRMSGNHFISGVRHQIYEGKWETDVQFGLDPKWFTELYDNVRSKLSTVSSLVNGLQVGVVTKLEGDPDGENRIQVKLPVINPDEEGVWSRLACLDAGDGRGTFFRPEIGDEVVVGTFASDPLNPVVLGMLHSSAKPTPKELSDDNHEKGYISRSEMKLLFNDDKKSVTLETPAGKTFKIDEDAGSIVLEDENSNTITMNSDGISMESGKDLNIKATGDVNIEGVNVNTKAQASYKAEGSAGAELTSSANVKIQGALVQIN
ncbi:MAG: type VI secretion system tip protein VgrG [Bacteroidales bacterium]